MGIQSSSVGIQDEISKPENKKQFILSITSSDPKRAQPISESILARSYSETKYAIFTKGKTNKVRYWMTTELFIVAMNVVNPPIAESTFLPHRFRDNKFVSIHLDPCAYSNMNFFMENCSNLLRRDEFLKRIIKLNKNVDPLISPLIQSSKIQLFELPRLSPAIPVKVDEPDLMAEEEDDVSGPVNLNLTSSSPPPSLAFISPLAKSKNEPSSSSVFPAVSEPQSMNDSTIDSSTYEAPISEPASMNDTSSVLDPISEPSSLASQSHVFSSSVSSSTTRMRGRRPIVPKRKVNLKEIKSIRTKDGLSSEMPSIESPFSNESEISSVFIEARNRKVRPFKKHHNLRGDSSATVSVSESFMSETSIGSRSSSSSTKSNHSRRSRASKSSKIESSLIEHSSKMDSERSTKSKSSKSSRSSRSSRHSRASSAARSPKEKLKPMVSDASKNSKASRHSRASSASRSSKNSKLLHHSESSKNSQKAKYMKFDSDSIQSEGSSSITRPAPDLKFSHESDKPLVFYSDADSYSKQSQSRRNMKKRQFSDVNENDSDYSLDKTNLDHYDEDSIDQTNKVSPRTRSLSTRSASSRVIGKEVDPSLRPKPSKNSDVSDTYTDEVLELYNPNEKNKQKSIIYDEDTLDQPTYNTVRSTASSRKNEFLTQLQSQNPDDSDRDIQTMEPADNGKLSFETEKALNNTLPDIVKTGLSSYDEYSSDDKNVIHDQYSDEDDFAILG
ncbi:hypothetical protein TRFO_01018 [Tritrichomonas foetus]|uniref:Uncharacterized protein n=1 Tax=Tritrichomonas foetus TaxID=1144522 RepID=A0A1J4L6Y3_9EUKA|nr:hypothetical protein TRFO_01018 [Tritrichomonas foetus]|eukprot:OHT17702.1 hypothetical protein TRFO_01018 [Tritrichomonas foetus]